MRHKHRMNDFRYFSLQILTIFIFRKCWLLSEPHIILKNLKCDFYKVCRGRRRLMRDT